jgi:hypothetical protein
MNEALMNPTPTVAREDMQSVMGKQMTPEDGLAMLLAAKSKSTQPYWANLDPIMVESQKPPSRKEVKLRCTQCYILLSPSNPSNLKSAHFDEGGKCKAASKSMKSSASTAIASSSGSSKRVAVSHGNEGAFALFRTPVAVVDEVISQLTAYIVKRATPSSIEDENLINAFRALGVTLPSRKMLCKKHIPKLYEQVKSSCKERVDFDKEFIGAMATDGWKKGACGQGTPLINCSLLLPEGGSYFVKVVPAPGVVKDATWVVELHNNLANEITECRPDKLLGVLLDNTKTNRKALKMLEEEHPKWLGIGCQVRSSTQH